MNSVEKEPDIRFFWQSERTQTHDRLVSLLKEFGDLLPDPLSQWLRLEEYASKLLDRADIGYAFHQDEVVGLMALYANDHATRVAFLPMISVLPFYQGRGIGTAMMSRAIALARQRDMRHLRLTVRADNGTAHRIYASLGFRKITSTSPRFVMELDLFSRGMERQVTAIESGSRLASAFGLDIDLRIKRDDLYPLSGGGIKARKIGYIVKDAIERGYDALVTNGGPQSNHARATAILAANLGLKCHLVIVLDPGTRYPISGNILLMKMSGATVEYCVKDELATRMDQAVNQIENKGHRPLYIWGGGHCLPGTVAFVEAAVEAREQCGDWIPDFVVLASGTGSTQAGLAIGYVDLPTQVVGISVARKADRGSRIVRESIEEYFTANNRSPEPIDVIFRDDWIDGGYEQYSPELFSAINQAAKTGFFFDPTYSGKALRGLISMVGQGAIPSESRVLLWHTGGLINLLAIPQYTQEMLQV